MLGNLKIPILISFFFSSAISSYSYFTLKKENLAFAGKSMGYKFIDKQFPPEKVSSIFKTVYQNNQSEINQLLPKIKDGEDLENWCKDATKGKWDSENGRNVIYGLKWCSMPVHLVLGRTSNKFDESKFDELFKGTNKPKINEFIHSLAPNLVSKNNLQSDQAKLLFKGVVNGFCNKVLNDAWSNYYVAQQTTISELCPEGEQEE